MTRQPAFIGYKLMINIVRGIHSPPHRETVTQVCLPRVLPHVCRILGPKHVYVQTSIFLANVRVPLRATKLPHMILNSKNWIMVVMIVYNAMSRGFPPRTQFPQVLYEPRRADYIVSRANLHNITHSCSLSLSYLLYFTVFFFPYITC